MIALPKKIKVGAHVVSVKESRTVSGLGDYNRYHNRIRVQRNSCDSQKRASILHEVLHAVFRETGLHRDHHGLADKEELIVQTLEPMLLQVLRDNPSLVGYITNG